MSDRDVKYVIGRKGRRIIFAVAVVIFAAAVILDRSAKSQKADISLSSPGQDFAKYNSKKFDVVKVVDGDTIDIDMPDGRFDNTRIRLLGIDTPETENSPLGQMYYGPEASEFVKSTLAGQKVQVIIDTSRPLRDKYNRLLAYIELEDGTILNELILSRGFGYADTRFEHMHFNRYTQLQRQAIEKRAGLWKDIRFEQLPGWLKRNPPELLPQR